MNSSYYPFYLLPSVFPSIRVFSNKSPVHIRWPKYWSFSFSISTSNKYSGLISFRIDWFHLLAVQGTLWSLLQHYNLKASILRHSAFFMVQFSHLYMTTGKTIALTIWTFVSKVISLLFNTLSRFVIAFLPRTNRLLFSWLQSPATVILEPKKKKSITASSFSSSVCFEVWVSKITADGNCSHEIKRPSLLGRKVMTNLDSILKSRDITLPTKVCLVKAMVFQ